MGASRGKNFFISPINHQNPAGRVSGSMKRLNTARNWLRNVCAMVFYIHSKTACRGFKSFCPCQRKPEKQLLLRLPSVGKNSLNCGTRSVRRGAGALWAPFSADRAGRRDKSLLLQICSIFRFCFALLLTFPSGTSSKEHQKNWRIRPSFPWKNSPLGGGGAGNSRRVRLPLVFPLLAYIWDKRALNSGDI